MFEYERDIVAKLLEDSPEFRSLYNRHSQLKQQVRDAETGVAATDSVHIGVMKKQKLLAKDRMAAMIAQYQRENAPTAASR